jgi:hypothetical protein
MRAIAWGLVLVAAAAGGYARAGDGPAVDPARLVAALSSSDFRVRESAARELDHVGEPALAALREAARGADAETRRRATEIIERIARRQAVDRVLAPTFVDLRYDRVPLAAVVNDLSRRIGTPITLHGETADLVSRPVTLVAEKVSVWQAIRLLCNRAGLHEWDGVSAMPSAVSLGSHEPVAPADGVIVLGQLMVRRGQVAALTVNSPAPRIALVEGAGPNPPIHRAGSVRIRAAPPGAPFPTDVGRDSLVVLQVAAEGRYSVDGACDLRIDRAVDEQGRGHAVQAVWPPPPDDRDDWPRAPRLPAAVTNRKRGPVAVRLPRDDPPARRLAHLAGTATVQAFVTEQTAEFARPVHAAGRTVRTADVACSLVSFRADGDEVRTTVEVQLPYGVRLESPVAGPVGIGGRGGRFWAGGQIEMTEEVRRGGTDYQGLSVLDAVGRRFELVGGETVIAGLFAEHFTIRIAATYRLPAAKVEAARVIFAVRRPALVEVPFSLRDVPLP